MVRDTLEDERFADNPLVRQAPHIRFYAGEPLRNRDGFVFGTLCAIDRRPRDLSEEQRSSLRVLANQVSLLLELRRRAKLLAENQASLALFHQFFLQGRDLKYALELTTGDLVLNPAWVTTTGWTLDELKGGLFSELIHPDDATATRLAIDGLVEGADAKFENRCRAMDGTWIWLSWIVQSRDGRLLATGRSPAPRARICRRCRGS